MGVVERLNAERVRRGEELKKEAISWLTSKNKLDIGMVAANEISRMLVEFLRNWRTERDSEPRLALSVLFVDETVSRLRNVDTLRAARESASAGKLITALDRFPCPDDPLIADPGQQPVTRAVDTPYQPGPPGPMFQQGSGLAATIVEVASYVGAAALGGVIGNRADAAVLVAVRQLFGTAISRWRSRRSSAADLALTETEAKDVALAAVLAQRGAEHDSVAVLAAAPGANGSWSVEVRSRSEELHVSVDAGDPAHAKILILGGSPRWSQHRPGESL